MSCSNLSLEPVFKSLIWEYYLRNLSQEEAKKILLVAIRQIFFSDRSETKLKLQIWENYISSLSREQAQNIILQAIYRADLVD